MSPGQEILRQIETARHSGRTSITVSARGSRSTVRANILKANDIGVSVSEIEASAHVPGPLKPGEAEGWARRFCDRARYLLEPLQPIEIDQQQNEVLVRSVPPDQSETEVRYYEARVSGQGRAKLQRFTYDRNQRHRKPEPMNLTHEQLKKLVDDVDRSAPRPPSTSSV
jgi:hypothetical protein